MRKNVIKRSLMVLMTVIVTTVFCTAAASAASVKVLSTEKVKGDGKYRYSYNAKGKLTKISRNGKSYRNFTYNKSGRLVKMSYVDHGAKGTVNYKYDKKHRLSKSVDKGCNQVTKYYYKKTGKRPCKIVTTKKQNKYVTHVNPTTKMYWNKFNLPTKWNDYGVSTNRAQYNKKGHKVKSPAGRYTYRYSKNKFRQYLNGNHYRTCTFKTIKVKTKKQAKDAKKAQYLIVDHRMPVI